ncbi:TetR/AcrR family transcriptional regulator [Spongiibacter sp.]|uniref:TetR/AcrR family transcriptional regulator n=1 Tax=Spongiibacter sp. TaxID=2024860 RepID=UPI003563B83F
MAADTPQKPRKSKLQFIHAALDILATTGSVKALTIDRLCRQLGISKGSFYWHFKGRAELIEAVVDFWADEFQQSIHQNIRQASDNEPSRTFEELVSFWLSSNFAQLDQVMRNWARQEAAVAKAVQQADLLLMDFVSQQIVAMGHQQTEAQYRARLLIAVGIAEPQISHLPHPGSLHETVNWVAKKVLS